MLTDGNLAGAEFCIEKAGGLGHIGSLGGEMAEWFKAHAWKACVGNTTVSSNLTLSASFNFAPDGDNG